MKKYRIYTKINGQLHTWEGMASSHEEARGLVVTRLIVKGVQHSAVLAVLA